MSTADSDQVGEGVVVTLGECQEMVDGERALAISSLPEHAASVAASDDCAQALPGWAGAHACGVVEVAAPVAVALAAGAGAPAGVAGGERASALVAEKRN